MRYPWSLTLFAVTMAYIESAVVVYLRERFFPGGFGFPLAFIPAATYGIELGRELAALAMLFAVSRLSGRDPWERFLHFCYLFGVWDLFYYLWLKLFLGWPESLLTWDVLFLFPLPWLAPVLAPVLVAVALVAGSVHLLGMRRRGARLAFPAWSWTVAIAAGLLVIGSFLWNYRVAVDGGVPDRFPWLLYGAGFAAGAAAYLGALRGLRARGREGRNDALDRDG